MSQFPLKFEVLAEAKPGISSPWSSYVNGLDPIAVSIPPEFHGPGKAYSPEDLYGLSVLNCLISIYKYFCEKENITFEKINGKIIVNMEKKLDSNELILSHLDITFDVTNASDKEKAKTLLEKALKECPVTNSIKSGKTCHINIV